MSWQIYRHKKRPEIRYYAKLDEDRDEMHLKACRNVRFDDEDFPPEMAPEAGMWPYGAFMELYEKEEG